MLCTSDTESSLINKQFVFLTSSYMYIKKTISKLFQPHSIMFDSNICKMFLKAVKYPQNICIASEIYLKGIIT